MVICKSCGKSNPGDAKFCSECGERLSGDVLPGFVPSSRSDAGAAREDSVRRLLEMAFWHSDTGNYVSAMRACQAVLVMDADNVSALSLLGCVYEKQGKIDEAIKIFERVVDLNPASVADQEKLERLLNGFTEAAVKPPAAYRWIPPALARYASINRYAPAAAAVVVGVVVLVVGLGILRAIAGSVVARQPADQIQPIASAPARAPSPAAPPAASAPPAPAPSPAAPVNVASAPQPIARPASASVMGPIAQPNAAPLRIKGHRSVGTRADQDSLTAAAAPALPSESAIKPLEPGPEAKVTASSDVPEHTVVVAAPSASPAAAQPATSMVQDPPPPPPHIEIHFHTSSAAGPVESTSVPQAPQQRDAGGMHGAQLQSRAMQLQEQGQYNQAVGAYRSAIDAYQADISAGRNVDFARRGIASCQTGIKICNQSQ